MNQSELLKILESVKAGELAPDKAIERLKHLPFEDLGFAKVDHHRALRQGFAEVVLGKGKTPQQVAEIVRAMLRKKDSRHNILVTRADKKIFAAVKRAAGKNTRIAKFHELSGAITIERSHEITGKGTIQLVKLRDTRVFSRCAFHGCKNLFVGAGHQDVVPRVFLSQHGAHNFRNLLR